MILPQPAPLPIASWDTHHTCQKDEGPISLHAVVSRMSSTGMAVSRQEVTAVSHFEMAEQEIESPEQYRTSCAGKYLFL